LGAAQGETLCTALPWRSFRWHKGQRHYSGYYWCARTGRHVVYESRLELARLILADFDPRTRGIAAQPFLVEATLGAKLRRHVPDFLLLGEDQLITVVNVKPADRLTDPKVAEGLEWSGRLFEERGWASEIWSGLDEVTMSNLRFLAGYRRSAVVDHQLVVRVSNEARSGESIEDVERRVALGDDRASIRPAILHLLWTGRLRADLTGPIGPGTLLERAS